MGEEREVDLLSYLPQYMLEFRELRVILKSEEPEFVLAWEKLQRWLKNRFILEADAEGIQRFEDYLRIRPFDTDSLEDRRRRLLGLKMTGLPYTLKKLQEVLYQMCGSKNVKCTVDYEHYTVTVSVMLASIRSLDFIREITGIMVPSNMLLDIRVIYNRWQRFRRMTWGALRTETWKSLHEDRKWQEGS